MSALHRLVSAAKAYREAHPEGDACGECDETEALLAFARDADLPDYAWTPTRPTEPGAYWCAGAFARDVELVQVDRRRPDGPLIVLRIDYEDDRPLSELEGALLWCRLPDPPPFEREP